MAKNTSILLGDHFDEFIDRQINSGKYASVSEVVRAALRVLEDEESRKTALISELKKGERSGFVEDFDRNAFLKKIHKERSGQE